jgi:hypothetical protein
MIPKTRHEQVDEIAPMLLARSFNLAGYVSSDISIVLNQLGNEEQQTVYTETRNLKIC